MIREGTLDQEVVDRMMNRIAPLLATKVPMLGTALWSCLFTCQLPTLSVTQPPLAINVLPVPEPRRTTLPFCPACSVSASSGLLAAYNINCIWDASSAIKPEEWICRDVVLVFDSDKHPGKWSGMATSFTLPKVSGEPSVEVTLPPNLTREQFLGFKPFNVWLEALRKSFDLQSEEGHAFNLPGERYTLRSIEVQSVDFFGKRIGFIKMKTVVKNENDPNPLPGIVFLRGGSVAILMILRPEGYDHDKDERYVIMTQQPRVPAGSLTFFEIPAGMIDDAGTFAGAAANELFEETQLTVLEHELKDLTKLALKDAKTSESHLQKAMYPSPGGCDEYIALFLWERTMPRIEINELRNRIAGNDKEKITVKLVKYEELWREGARDAKTLAAWALYEGLTREGRLEDDDDDDEEEE